MTRTRAKTWKVALATAGFGIAVLGGYLGYRYSAEKPVAKLHLPPPRAPQPPPAAFENIPAQKTPEAAHRIPLGQVLGSLEIPRLHISVPIIEGTDERELKRGAGHVPSTAIPGPTGNVAVAAHRDKYFRPLRNIRADDKITVGTPHGRFHYVVRSTEIVPPSDVGVLHQTRDSELTLITCFPFYYVGHAPKRFIVHASAAPQLDAADTRAETSAKTD